jgi:DoxX-like family
MTLHAAPLSGLVWLGRVFSGLAIAFLLFDGVIKLPPIQAVTDTLQELSFAPTNVLARGLGLLCLFCTALYAIPRTSLLGAILLTGYLGGAIAIQIRAGNPVFSHVLFGTYVGLLLWAGLLLRNSQARAAIFPQ